MLSIYGLRQVGRKSLKRKISLGRHFKEYFPSKGKISSNGFVMKLHGGNL